MRVTHSYAILKVSLAAFDEIKRKLEVVGYEEAFHEQEDGLVIDMHGIALQAEEGT